MVYGKLYSVTSLSYLYTVYTVGMCSAPDVILDIIKSTSDLLPYAEYFESHLILLGTVLNVMTQATAIERGPGDPTSKCLKILQHWLEVTPDPTWNEFCSALKSNKTFNRARNQIEKDHCKPFIYVFAAC